VYIDGGGETLTLAKYRLTVVDGPDEGLSVCFEGRTTLIGVSPDADFVLNDPSISRIHATIEVDGTGYHLKDRSSKNGCWLGNWRVGDVYLESGSSFKLGCSTLRFELTQDEVDIHFSSKKKFGALLGQSREMRQIFALLERVAPTDATVLIEGESGTGKELVAKALHDHSKRKDGPFIVFDCSAVPRDLIESELFGHVKGAFTGATATRKGAFEQASGGTIFLDELGELDLDLQPKLLRALESRQVKPVGGLKPIDVDVRIVGATNRNLIHEVREGNFRQDLYYRFEIIKVKMPPLRERIDDIPMLVEHFLGTAIESTGRADLNIGYKTMEKLKRHHWPGNVRELVNFVSRASLLADTDKIETRHLNFQPTSQPSPSAEGSAQEGDHLPFDITLPFKEAKQHLLDDFETRYWVRLLEQTDGNISKAGRIAGMHRKSVAYILKRLDLSADEIAAAKII
jgi:DNA-binding NtrC family response regulator